MFRDTVKELNNQLRQIKTAQARLAQSMPTYRSNTVQFTVPPVYVDPSTYKNIYSYKVVLIHANAPLTLCDPYYSYDLSLQTANIIPWYDNGSIGYRVYNLFDSLLTISFSVVANQEISISVV